MVERPHSFHTKTKSAENYFSVHCTWGGFMCELEKLPYSGQKYVLRRQLYEVTELCEIVAGTAKQIRIPLNLANFWSSYSFQTIPAGFTAPELL